MAVVQKVVSPAVRTRQGTETSDGDSAMNHPGTTRSGQGRAYPRVGILGNPSDGYGGQVLAATFVDFVVEARVRTAQRWRFQSGAADGFECERWPEAERALAATKGSMPLGETGGTAGALGPAAALLVAAVRRGIERMHARSNPDRDLVDRIVATPLEVSFTSDVPRQSGLSGSSAIVLATLRALFDVHGATCEPDALAAAAWKAESEDLGITAGPQDRVIQAHGGMRFMDFSVPGDLSRHRSLDPGLLPPSFVVHDPSPGEPSSAAHATIRARWEAGEPDVRRAIARFPEIASRGVAALERGDREEFCRTVNENFNTRASIWPLAERDREMIRIGREQGAATKFCGSGGAIFGVAEDEEVVAGCRVSYERAGYRFLRPRWEGLAS